MGYTHYFSRTRAFTSGEWLDITTHARTFISMARVYGVDVAGPVGSGRPVITDNEIALNGRGEDGFETFALSREPGGWEFCKTARRDYDDVVTAILLYASRRAPDAIAIDSDGDMDGDDWRPARELVDRAGLGETPARRMPVNGAVLDARAAECAVIYDGDGIFHVSKDADSSRWYEVVTTGGEPETWDCQCAWSQHGGAMCAHVRAVALRWPADLAPMSAWGPAELACAA